MNNLIVAMLVFLLGGGVYFLRQQTVVTQRLENRTLIVELDQARAELELLRQKVSEAELRLADRREKLVASRSEVARVARAARFAEAPPPDPAAEGAWPPTKSYFYFHKKHLRRLGFTMMQSDKHLSDEAGVLFGMTSAERASVDNSIQQMWEAVQRLQSGNAQLEPSAVSRNSVDHQAITYHMPSLTNEVIQIQHECESSIADTLGGNRSALFVERIKPSLDRAYGEFGNHDYSVTLRADRDGAGNVTHCLEFSFDEGHGRSTYSYPVEFPLTSESPLWNYRHLFGQAPLLTKARELQGGASL
jgi:hypothetical protein